MNCVRKRNTPASPTQQIDICFLQLPHVVTGGAAIFKHISEDMEASPAAPSQCMCYRQGDKMIILCEYEKLE
jgi:hypothetical protein